MAQMIGPQQLKLQQQRQGTQGVATRGTVPGLYYDPSGELSPSLSQLHPADQSGYFRVPRQYQARTKRTMGYDPSRAWARGATPDKMLKIGDLQQSKYLNIGQMTLRGIAAKSGTPIERLPLDQVTLVRNMTVEELFRAYPQMRRVPLREIPFLARTMAEAVQNPQQLQQQALAASQKAVLQELGQNSALEGIPVLQLAQGDWGKNLSELQQSQLKRVLNDYPEIAQLPIDKAFPVVNGVIAGDWQSVSQQAMRKGLDLTGEELFKAVPELKNMPLGALPIKNLSIASLPGIVDRPLQTLPNIAGKYVSELPGLSQIPVNKLPINFALSTLTGDLFGRLDVAYAGAVETPVANVATGGTKDQKFKPEPCRKRRCAHFELDNADGGGPPGNLSGKAWVEGKAQKVEGGKGMLRAINGGKEPTGIPIWGTDVPITLSLEDIKEGGNGKPATARVQANFQFCIDVPIARKQCSPHFIPIPTPWQVQEGGLMLVASTGQPPAFLRRARDRLQAEYEAQYGGGPDCNSDMYIASTAPQLVASKGKLPPATNAAQQNLQRYLARIAAGESSGGRNMGPNPDTGARGEYQFTLESRQSIMNRYPPLDPWSQNKQMRDKAAVAWIGLYSRERGVDILGAIQQGNFQLADRMLGRNQFTSLPGGAEQHALWTNPANHDRYGPVGKGAPLLAAAQQQCVGVPSSSAQAVKAGSINQRISQAAARSYRMDTSAGPDGGNNACLWSVNKVLAKEGVAPLGSAAANNYVYVPFAEAALQAGRGKEIGQRFAKAGDIVIAKGQAHIGICMDTGCNTVLSNSSSTATFKWQSDVNFQGSYDRYGGTSKIYHIIK